MLSTKLFSVTALALGISLGWTLAAQDAKPAKNWKDRAEFDMFDAANKSAAKDRVAALDKWKQAYAASEFADEREDIYLITYSELGDCRKAFDKSVDILKTRQNHERATAVVLGCLLAINPVQPADLDNAEKVAQHTIDALDTIYADANKGNGFASTKDATKASALRVLGYVPFAKKEYPKAEAALTKSLQADGTQAMLSNWLATALVQQNKDNPAKYPLGLFHFVRAASYDGPNSLPAAGRKPILDFVTKAYNAYHGSNEGFDALVAAAKANTFPPADFKIKSTVEIAEEKAKEEAAADAADPQKALWTKLLQAPLTADNGEQYFEGTVKDAELPGTAVAGVTKFKGKIVSMTPALRPKQLVVAVHDAAGDATLTFEEALPGKMEAGEEIQFSGTVKGFKKSPFMMEFEVEREQLVGWTGKGGPAPAKPAAAKPAAAKPAAAKPKPAPAK